MKKWEEEKGPLFKLGMAPPRAQSGPVLI